MTPLPALAALLYAVHLAGSPPDLAPLTVRSVEPYTFKVDGSKGAQVDLQLRGAWFAFAPPGPWDAVDCVWMLTSEASHAWFPTQPTLSVVGPGGLQAAVEGVVWDQGFRGRNPTKIGIYRLDWRRTYVLRTLIHRREGIDASPDELLDALRTGRARLRLLPGEGATR